MTDNWIIQDIEKHIAQRNRVVILDPTGQCQYLLSIIEKHSYTIFKTDHTKTEEWQTVQEELLLRFEAEQKFKNEKVVFYVTRPISKLSFLFDYCFTHGCIDLSNPVEWIRNKLFATTGHQITLDNPMLLTAAKLAIGKDISWWKKILQNLEELVSIEDELLPFLSNPETYLSNKEADVKRLFEEKLFELIGQSYRNVPPKTLATEVVNHLFSGLLNNDIQPELLSVYHKWLDSNTYSQSLSQYISGFQLPPQQNIWNVHPEHCFMAIDKLQLVQITANFRDKSFVKEKLQKLKKRIYSPKPQLFVPSWWQDVWSIFHADLIPLNNCKNLNAFVEYYTGTFSKVDRAIRNLYEVFLSEEPIIRPLQEYYEGLNDIVLQTWFEFYPEYKSDQQGYLRNLFSTSVPKTAVIVGDGLRYEIADYVASELQKQFKVDKQIMLADMPSETEHNMSALYVGGNEVLALQRERELRLSQATAKAIGYMQLEQLHYGVNEDYLILTYKDIDSAGEKLQQSAIKLFAEFETVLIDKITLLLNMGYADVYLITDHGFVLTGLLEEADKIDPNANGKKEVHERFIRTVNKQSNAEWLAFEEPYAEYNYVYAAKNHRPFKSKGVYGFSHGGFTPQEIIIPKFKFTKEKARLSQLSIIISNKPDLNDVPSELFIIKLDTAKAVSDLFASQRKVQIKLYAGNKEYQTSNIISMDAGKSENQEFSFNGNSNVQAVLIDAVTQEQLDSVVIKKSNLRDLGGL